VTATRDRHDGESLRVSHHGYWAGYARSVAELERWFDLTDLEEGLRRQRPNLSAVAGSCRGWREHRAAAGLACTGSSVPAAPRRRPHRAGLPASAERGLAPSAHQRKFGFSQIFSRRYSFTCAM
jgi:hypothetical protein